MEISAFCSQSRVLIVAGKGGVGKTTMVAALAHMAATMVVFPTPPLPATIRTRLCVQKVLISMTPRSVVSGPWVGAPADAGSLPDRHDPCRRPSRRWAPPRTC